MNSSNNLLEFSKQNIDTFVSSFDTVLTDCDGVLWINSSPIPGARDVINKLQTLGKRVLFVSNNATKTVHQYMQRFTSLGYNIKENEIIIPSVVISSYLKSTGFNKSAYVIGSAAFCNTIENSGIKCVKFETDWKEQSISGFIHQLRGLDTDVGAVIFDFDPNVNLVKLMQAKTLLQRETCALIVGATDEKVPISDDICLIGPGYFAQVLEKSSGREPLVAGKPSALLTEVIQYQHSIVPERTLFIGDSLSQDVAQGAISGFQTLLVLSGISKISDVENSKIQPKYILPSLGSLLPILEQK